jgi:hypothetical protein
VLIAIPILALLISALTSHSHWTPPLVNVAFLGFTNSGSSPEALFALTNPPAVAVSLHSVRGTARAEPPGPQKERGAFSWGRRESWGLVYAIGVDTTNEPLQAVLKFQQRSGSPRRLVEQVRELFGRLVGKERDFFTGHVFFVTNETRINTVALRERPRERP